MNLESLRVELQKPRRHKDSLYGRWVMRRLSIYVTAVLGLLPVSPFAINLASIIAGLIGAWLVASRHWVSGILMINLWYLLDHVDGELARYRRVFCATGLFFDSMANVIVIPAAFAASGFALAHGGPNGLKWFFVGLTAGYGSMMMFVVPYCEAAVILQRFHQGRLQLNAATVTPGMTASQPSQSFFKKIFSILHETATFPVFLPAATACVLISAIIGGSFAEKALGILLVVYAVLTTAIWVAVTAHTVLTLKIDRKHPLIPQ